MSTQTNGHFRGRFEIKVDPKFRLTLPVAFRDVLKTHSSNSPMVITNSQYQGKRCLDVYPFSEWKKLEGRISKLPQLKVEVQNFQRFYLSGGHPIDLDGQGRVLIPPTLRTYASLQSEIVLVGFANKFEIWAVEVWNGLFENLAQDFNQTLAAISDMDTADGEKNHLPVMEKEVVTAFSEQPKAPAKLLDGTFGRGGHTRALLKKFPKAKVFGFDRDEEALAFAKKEFSLEIKENRLSIVHDDFRNFANYNLGPFDGALFDLGVSSPQFDEAERGFSIQNDGPLDMRMDRRQEITASDLVNNSTEKELSDIFFNWGEVRHPNRVVRAIVHDRETEPFTRTRQLSSLIDRVEKAARGKSRGKTHFATPYFMALRIAVNQELENLAQFFETVPTHIEDGGRVVVISFHSLEDRIVKWVFRRADKVQGRIITKKVVIPTDEEIAINPRSRSAKLRVFEKGGLS